MASLKELRNRIASVKATQKITKAMQMVAAAKLRRAQTAAEASRPYTSAMSAVISNLAGGVADISLAPKLMGGTGENKTHLLVVCTAERGLCGAFNSSIARKARDDANALLRDGKQVKILCVGKKGNDVLRRLFGDKIIGLIEFRSVKSIGFAQATQVGEHIVSLFEQGAFDVCTLYFSEFKSVILQIPTAQQLIPVPISADQTGPKTVYEYEPEQEALLNDLLPKNLNVQVFKALLENAASEQGARMSAMDNATRNAGDMIRKQTLTYNRTRQAMITKELIEIISGAEAL